MAVMNGASTGKPNAGDLSSVVEDEKEENQLLSFQGRCEEATLSGVFNLLIESISDPNRDETSTTPMANRIKKSLMEAAPMFREAIINTRRQVLLWTRRGSPLRALLVVSVSIPFLFIC